MRFAGQHDDDWWAGERDIGYLRQTEVYLQAALDENRVLNQRLSERQMRQIYIAADYHDWQSIKDRFLMTMLEFGIASAHIYHDPQGKQLLVVFGTATATLILPIDLCGRWCRKSWPTCSSTDASSSAALKSTTLWTSSVSEPTGWTGTATAVP